MPRSRPGSATSSPSMMTRPASGGCVPRMARSSVDLPQPLGPTMATISPRTNFRLTSYRTLFLPNEWLRSLHSRTMSFTVKLLFGIVPGEQLLLGEAERIINEKAKRRNADDVKVGRRHLVQALLQYQAQGATQPLKLIPSKGLGRVEENQRRADRQ